MPGACDVCKAQGGVSRAQCLAKGHNLPAAKRTRLPSTRGSRPPVQLDTHTWGGRASQAARRQARDSRQGSETAGGDGEPLNKRQRMSFTRVCNSNEIKVITRRNTPHSFVPPAAFSFGRFFLNTASSFAYRRLSTVEASMNGCRCVSVSALHATPTSVIKSRGATSGCAAFVAVCVSLTK